MCNSIKRTNSCSGLSTPYNIKDHNTLQELNNVANKMSTPPGFDQKNIINKNLDLFYKTIINENINNNEINYKDKES